jgi:signal transduction histidine kinase/CheY-like chemotaxis protein/ligand-binding sensor domain-containing protein/AraC-like DNA-binding protein
MLQDNDDAIWVCTDKGLFSFNRNGQIIEHFKERPDGKGLLNNYVHFILKVDDWEYLVGTDRGLNRFFPKEDRFEAAKFDNIRDGQLNLKGFTDGVADKNGNVWLSMSEGIIYGKKQVSGKFHFSLVTEGEKSLNSKIIRDIFVSRSGLVWVGTKFGGLNIHNSSKQIFQHYTVDNEDNSMPNSENSFILSCLEDNENRIWLGSKYGGLLEFNRADGTVRNKFIFDNEHSEVFASRVESISQLNDGTIMTGTIKGLVFYDPEGRWIRNKPFHMVNAIKRDRRGNLWLGTEQGIYQFNEISKEPVSFEKSNPHAIFSNKNIYIYVIFEDRSGNIWFGTRENGIYVYNPADESVVHRFHEQNNPQSLSGDMVRDIQQDDKGRVWVATKHSGLCYFDSTSNSFVRFSKLDGLPSNTIYSILKDNNGDMWLGTHHGLSKLDLNSFTFNNYDTRFGLQGNIFENDARMLLSTGELLFGGKNGFNIFIPDSIKLRSFLAPLVISEIRVNDQVMCTDLTEDTSIVLKHNQNYISFEFALLDFMNPDGTRYKYHLEGVDKEWVSNSARNYVSYPKLRSGTYKFSLQAINQDNVVTNVISTHIKINPPVWGTKWAFITYLALFISMIIILFNLATIQMNYKHHISEATNKVQRTLELNRTKLQFFTNISHELRTPLSLIMAPLENLMESQDLSDKDRKDLDMLFRNTKRLNNLINQLLYFRKMEHKNAEMRVKEGNIVAFVKEIVYPYYELAAKQKIVFNIISEEDDITLWFDPDKIEKIISNLLMNAFKFTSFGGKISVVFSLGTFNENEGKWKNKIGQKNSTEMLKITVADTGIGMTKEQVKYIFDRFYVANDHKKGIGVGLELTRTLVELHGGKITVDTEPSKGSAFHIWLRKGNEHFKKEYFSDQKIDSKEFIKEIDHDLFDIELNEEGNLEEWEKGKEVSNEIKKPVILVVDDNKDIRFFLRINLTPNFNVVTAENGVEGVKLAKKHMPELILSDVMMPEMDGIELCKTLKSNITTSHIPIILLTAKAQIENKLEGMATGADDYIEKPFNFQFLQLRIKNLLLTREKLKNQILEKVSKGSNEELDISEYDKRFLEKCKNAIEENFADPNFSVVELSKFAGMSRSQLHRKLKALTDTSPIEWIYNFRLEKAREILQDKKFNVSDVAYMTGFNSPSSFSTVFRKKYGLAPSELLEK